MSTVHILFTANDSVLEVTNLRNEMSGESLNAATVSVTLNDEAGQPVAGATWPMTMTYLADSQGVYRCTLPYSLALVTNGRYQADIVVDAGAGMRAAWSMACVARERN